MTRLAGRTALITGAASGIGLATAERFAREGARIAGLDLQKPIDAARWSALESTQPGSFFQEGVDVRDEAGVAAAVARVCERFGRIDVLVNAAGVGDGGATHELAEATWDRVIDINMKGVFLVSKHVLPSMLAQRGGSVIHLASVEGLEGMPGALPYGASKAGVVLMTKTMALEVAAQGIRVNCLCPGLIETPLTRVVWEMQAVHDQMVGWHAMGRAGKPEEIAAAALFLASDDASFVTGHALVVDGGWTAGRRLVF